MNRNAIKTNVRANDAGSAMKMQPRVHFFSMVRADLVKIMWLRSTWVMLFLLISGAAFVSLINATGVGAHQMLQQDPVQYVYTYELSENLLIFRVLSGFLVLLVTAFAIGLEYQQGTMRVILGRGVGRVRFLFSKMSALFLFALLVTLGGVLLNGCLLVVNVGADTGSLNALGVILSRCLGLLGQYYLYLLFNMWVSILLAMALTILGRSLTFGLSAALLWFPVDNILSNVLVISLRTFLPVDLTQKLSNAFLGPELNALPLVAISTHIVSQSMANPFNIGGWPTIAIILVYALAFLSLSVTLMRRRDVL
jgi:ABC-type transport system involved in multi-copper enzyme maturation permease subunit